MTKNRFALRTAAILLALAAFVGLGSCQDDSGRRAKAFAARAGRELKLTAEQRTLLESALVRIGDDLRSRRILSDEELAAYRDDFVAGAAPADLVLRARNEKGPEIEAARLSFSREVQAFLDSLTPEQRGALFDFLVKRRQF